MKKPQPRMKYGFEKMELDSVMKINTDGDDQAGMKALRAAYAYGRRNDQKFCGAADVFRGKSRMLIRRIK